MTHKPRVFLDTSAIFAGIWSAAGGGRMILKLGEASALQPVTASIVLEELERALREKAPEQLGTLAILMDRARFEIVPSQTETSLKRALDLVSHVGDAHVLSAALSVELDYFVTLDKKHFIRNKKLHKAAPFPIGTPGDFLEWFRGELV